MRDALRIEDTRALLVVGLDSTDVVRLAAAERSDELRELRAELAASRGRPLGHALLRGLAPEGLAACRRGEERRQVGVG